MALKKPHYLALGHNLTVLFKSVHMVKYEEQELLTC